MQKIRIVFLDRDGVINKSPGNGYVTAWRQFRFLPGAKKALKRLTDAGYKIFVVSNQSGVSKGVYSKKRLDEITRRMLKALDNSGARIDGVYYCIHREEENCSCRKPRAGLLKIVAQEHAIPAKALKQGYFVGDSIRDIQAGRSAGCRTILVFSGKEKPGNRNDWLVAPDFIASDLPEAVELILSFRDSPLRGQSL